MPTGDIIASEVQFDGSSRPVVINGTVSFGILVPILTVGSYSIQVRVIQLGT